MYIYIQARCIAHALSSVIPRLQSSRDLTGGSVRYNLPLFNDAVSTEAVVSDWNMITKAGKN
jgi:hypothetical protein